MRGVAVDVDRQPGDAVADPGAARAAGEGGAPVVGRLRLGEPVGVDEQVGERGRRQDRLVASGREVDRPLRPSRAASPARRPRPLHVGLRRVAQGEAEVARRRPVGVLGVHLQPPGGLHVAQPQPGGRAEVDRVDDLLGEAEVLAVRHPSRAAPHRDRRPGRRTRRCSWAPARGRSRRPGAGLVGRDERRGVGTRLGPRGRRPRPRRRASRTSATSVTVRSTTPEAVPCPDGRRRDDGHRPRRHLAVGRQRAVGPAEVGLGAVGDDDDGAVGRGGRQGGLDELLRGGGGRRCRPSVTRLLHGVEDADAAEQGGRGAVAGRGHLAGLGLAAVEGAAAVERRPARRPPPSSARSRSSSPGRPRRAAARRAGRSRCGRTADR